MVLKKKNNIRTFLNHKWLFKLSPTHVQIYVATCKAVLPCTGTLDMTIQAPEVIFF